MISSAKIEELLKPVRNRGGEVSLHFGTVVAIVGSKLTISLKPGGVIYADNYVFAEVGDLVSCLAYGSTVVAFAAKDAARLENELKNIADFAVPTMSSTTRGVAKVGAGLAMDGEALHVNDISAAFIAAL